MDIKNKTVLITGASDGIGKEIALRLAKEKANLILLGRDKGRLNEVKKKSLKVGAKEVDIYSFDISDKNSVTDHLEKIRSKHKDIACIVNNAGIWQKLGDIDQIKHNEIENVIGTNLTGLIKLTNTLLPVLRKQKEAVIINVSSRSGYSAQSGQALYTASKYGVRGFTESLREDLKDTHIRVAGVYQGGTNTKMFEKAGENWKDELYQTFIPANELAEVVVFMITRTNQVWLPEVRVENK
jgi:NADP-dependent 3-hydroxy acid dehydrogenase YdfG